MHLPSLSQRCFLLVPSPEITSRFPAAQINHLRDWLNMHLFMRTFVPWLEDEEHPLFRRSEVTFSTALSGADKLAGKHAC